MSLGEVLKEKRESKGLSLRQVEYKLKSKNIQYSHTNIKRLEDNKFDKVPIKVLSALAELFVLDKVTLFNLAGAALDETDERISKLNKRERTQLDDVMSSANHFFNDESINEEDKKKLYDSLQELYFDAKSKNKRKK
ncbi:XRE family transcriptional regulator [Leptotrichia sp. OH3620_COT-345]|uniref:helix-turn-helix domain-containing protein n=1 Tax=Leptotrichia sp. OH3620_COT-345 TaxID=2491048 RepID=UPI000F647928|nr:XRE family transcriptional regulator [Leptotrichia sp. OH3620_COT-345]RRD39099.1 XRE family transcriptional regulator [Leptotrichia sp. OH3620_COT-345]